MYILKNIRPILKCICLIIATMMLFTACGGGSSTTASGDTSAASTGGKPQAGTESSSDSSSDTSESLSTSTPSSSVAPQPSSEPEPEPEPEYTLTAQLADWNTRVISREFPLEQSYSPELVSVGSGHYLDSRIVPAYEQMVADARAAGIDVLVVSTYRTPERSATLHQNLQQEYINQGLSEDEAWLAAAQWVAPAYTSEHNAGLAVDLTAISWTGGLVHDFDTTAAFDWYSTNCAKYGFILRYMEDKQDITGITYEPWHYRYVGEPHAEIIMNYGLSLEEYMAGAITPDGEFISADMLP